MQTEGMPEGKPPYLNDKEIGMFKATDWEPFEISPCTVPADFNTCFLSAQPTGEVTIFGTPDSGVIDALRAISPRKEKPAMETLRRKRARMPVSVNEQALAAAREEAVQAERQARQRDSIAGRNRNQVRRRRDRHQRVHRQGRAVDQARKECLPSARRRARTDANGNDFPIRGEPRRSVTRDGGSSALLACRWRAAARGWPVLPGAAHHNGTISVEYLDGCGPEQQQRAVEMAREYRNFKLIDMAKE
jgi:hypothetical protein